MHFGSLGTHSRVRAFVTSFAALALLACNKQEATVTPAEPKPVTIPLFSAPEDGVITASMASRYAKARAEMVEVNTRLLDSLGVSTPERKAVFSGALEMACEKVARRHGLRGLAEYQWIQNQAATSPQNRETLAQAGIVIP